MIKYYKNVILCGDVDYFCLLCHESFEDIDGVEKHIRWEKHRKLMKGQEYLPTFKKEGIYKIESKFYCEFCNIITSFNVIKNHIKNKTHLTNKANPENNKKESLAKRDLGLIIVSKYAVTNKDWHGVVNDQCLFCNTTVKNFDVHLKLTNHRINFTQATVKETKGHVYRKINEHSFYCFNCKNAFPVDSMEAHWTSEEHCGKNNPEQNSLFEIDIDNYIATCILCKKAINLGMDTLFVHMNQHVDKNEWPKVDEYLWDPAFRWFDDHGKLRADIKKFGKDHFVKLTEGGAKGYCSLCHTYISAHMTCFKQHVNGLRHQTHLELKGLVKKTKKTEKPRYKTRPFKTYFTDMVHVENSSVYINGQICIDASSFMLMALTDDDKRVICYLCDGIFPKEKHFEIDHKEKLIAVDVVTTFKDELIREIRPSVYHCGICNEQYAGWAVLEKHFNNFKHRFGKIDSIKKIDAVIESALDNFCASEYLSDIKTMDDVLD